MLQTPFLARCGVVRSAKPLRQRLRSDSDKPHPYETAPNNTSKFPRLNGLGNRPRFSLRYFVDVRLLTAPQDLLCYVSQTLRSPS